MGDSIWQNTVIVNIEFIIAIRNMINKVYLFEKKKPRVGYHLN